jgi:DNA-binding MarR family transcriptional regulator
MLKRARPDDELSLTFTESERGVKTALRPVVIPLSANDDARSIEPSGHFDLMHLLVDTSRLVREQFYDAMRQAELDITFTEYRLLLAVADQGTVTHADLLTNLFLNKSTLSALTGRLRTKGLIEQQFLPDDRRAKIVKLTETGYALVQRAATILEGVGFNICGSPQTKAMLVAFRESLLPLA